MTLLFELPGVELVTTDQCAHGLCIKGRFVRKSTGLLTNVHATLSRARCNGKHEHLRLEGGNLTAQAAKWPEAMSRSIIEDAKAGLSPISTIWRAQVPDLTSLRQQAAARGSDVHYLLDYVLDHWLRLQTCLLPAMEGRRFLQDEPEARIVNPSIEVENLASDLMEKDDFTLASATAVLRAMPFPWNTSRQNVVPSGGVRHQRNAVRCFLPWRHNRDYQVD